MQENKSLEGFQKKPMTLFILAVPLTQRCSTSLLRHANIWIALDILNQVLSVLHTHTGFGVSTLDGPQKNPLIFGHFL